VPSSEDQQCGRFADEPLTCPGARRVPAVERSYRDADREQGGSANA
jgi:hypothetical protein